MTPTGISVEYPTSAFNQSSRLGTWFVHLTDQVLESMSIVASLISFWSVSFTYETGRLTLARSLPRESFSRRLCRCRFPSNPLVELDLPAIEVESPLEAEPPFKAFPAPTSMSSISLVFESVIAELRKASLNCAGSVVRADMWSRVVSALFASEVKAGGTR